MREESRGAHTRLDHPGESAEWVKYNVIIKKGARRHDGGREAARSPRARRTSSPSRTRRSKTSSPAKSARTHKDTHAMAKATRSRSGAATPRAASSRSIEVDVDPGMVVLDVLHRIQAHAGERPRAALELQGRQVRLVPHGDQRQAAARVHDAHELVHRGRDDHVPAAEDVPGDQGSRHRRLA